MAKSKSSLLGTEDTHAVVQRAVEVALAVLQEQPPQNKPKKPPPSPRKLQRRAARAAADPKPSSSKHGFRGVPPPLADVSLAGLPDDQLLTEYEVAALTRLSTSTFEAWRKRPDHPLQWVKIGTRVRYRAGSVRQFIASGQRPRLGRPRKKDPAPAPKPPKRRPKPSGTPTATTKIHTHAAAPERHRTSRRPRAAEAVATEAT
jgi:hypothetical protein